jgi:CRISPR-associated protein Cmr1
MMQTRTFSARFLTPAFLGNAEQVGQWRTPPFKALLRQWWRVAYAADQGFEVNLGEMRSEEGRLFGVASDERGGSRKSEVRIRLDRWELGSQRDWKGLDVQKVAHPEVKNRQGHPVPIGAQLYLGYGPLVFSARDTALKTNAAIQSGEQALLRVAFPADHERAMQTVLQLIQLYGTLGGRSRNGWGSITLIPADESTPALDSFLDPNLTRPWREALSIDWPHAIGQDEIGPLVWRTQQVFRDPRNLPDWRNLMRLLAEIKIGLRTQFSFRSGRNASRAEERHWLSYPVTNHNVAPWRERGRGDFRLPNSLRFKARPDPEGGIRGVIFHVPCLPPDQFHPDRLAIERVWQRVHAFLDDPAQKLSRIPA